MKTFYEFFAGGGMANAGLGADWRCLFANDIDPMKGAAYGRNWGTDHLVVGDVNDVPLDAIPGHADLAWASFPCQDLSLAGNYAGIGAHDAEVRTRSGAFWSFWGKIVGMAAQGRAPRLVVLENVFGILTSNGGRDFAAIGNTLASAGYRFGAVVADATHFLPQSRPRVFVVAVFDEDLLPDGIVAAAPVMPWHPPALQKAYAGLSDIAKTSWLWWNLPLPEGRSATLEETIEDDPTGVAWHTDAETAYLLSLMDATNAAKIESAKVAGRRVVGTVYKRTRPDREGVKRQRAEVRFDGTAGCLRTPSGGSSRQTVVVVDGESVRSRLLSTREAARLMGLPDSYILPEGYNDAYHVAGDGVAVPVVAWLRTYIFEPILETETLVKAA